HGARAPLDRASCGARHRDDPLLALSRAARGRARRASEPGLMSLQTLNDIIEVSAEKFGDKDALIIKPGFRTRAWTYRDLADLVPRAARYLSEAGIKKGDRVLMC